MAWTPVVRHGRVHRYAPLLHRVAVLNVAMALATVGVTVAVLSPSREPQRTLVETRAA